MCKKIVLNLPKNPQQKKKNRKKLGNFRKCFNTCETRENSWETR